MSGFMSPNQRGPVLELVLFDLRLDICFWVAQDLTCTPYWFRGSKIPMLESRVGSRSHFGVGRVLKGEGKTNSETSGP